MVQRLCNRCKKIINKDSDYFKITLEHKISYGITTTDIYDLCIDCHVVFTSRFLEENNDCNTL